MNGNPFDLFGLIRAFVVSLASGLAVHTILSPIRKRRYCKQVSILAVIVVVLILTVILYFVWPRLITVPNLDNLSRAEAEDKLTNKGLTPDPRPHHVVGVEAGRVVPNSQDPRPGLKVRRGSVVSFAVAEAAAEPLIPLRGAASPSQAATVSLFEPKGGGTVYCTRTADAIYRFSVRGTSTGLDAGEFTLFLWVKPVNPPADAPGWYLQRPPVNGVRALEADGSWEGLAQVGSAQWPPHDGDIIDVAVSVAGRDVAERLMAEAGAVLRDNPVGLNSVRASGVVVRLK